MYVSIIIQLAYKLHKVSFRERKCTREKQRIANFIIAAISEQFPFNLKFRIGKNKNSLQLLKEYIILISRDYF